MNHFCPTIVVRHRKERLKKCSLRGLEHRKDFHFYTYPLQKPPSLDEYMLLSADAPELLSKEDQKRGILLLDGTWKLASQMEKGLFLPKTLCRRSLPPQIKTAYPRRQEMKQGLASIEALYIAYCLLERDTKGLLDHYYWKELFLEKNSPFTILLP